MIKSRRAGPCFLLTAALASGQVFLDEKQASRIVLRGCDAVEREERTLTTEDRVQLEKTTGLRFPTPRYTFLIGKRGGRVCGYAAILEEIGKSEPITFMAGVDPEGRAGEVALMVFRESRGAEVREPRFTRQFKGKRLKDPIRINRDILNYTGATLSSEAMARGVKKALALVDHFYLRRAAMALADDPQPHLPALAGRTAAGPRKHRVALRYEFGATGEGGPLVRPAGGEDKGGQPARSGGPATALFTRAIYVMGTVATVKLFATDETAAEDYAAIAFAELHRLEDIFTSFRDSELTRLNAAAAERPVQLSDEMFELLGAAIEYSRKYAGAFDPTVGPAVRAWGFMGGPLRMPGLAERQKIRELVGIDGIDLDPRRRAVSFRRRGMEIDFGGIAKGYAAEKVARLLGRRGVERGLVDLGESSLFSLGPPPGRRGWPVALRDDPSVLLELPAWSALSTSSTRTLFNPRTAEPVSMEASATVVCRSGAESEAAVKAILLRPDSWEWRPSCGEWIRVAWGSGS